VRIIRQRPTQEEEEEEEEEGEFRVLRVRKKASCKKGSSRANMCCQWSLEIGCFARFSSCVKFGFPISPGKASISSAYSSCSDPAVPGVCSQNLMEEENGYMMSDEEEEEEADNMDVVREDFRGRDDPNKIIHFHGRRNSSCPILESNNKPHCSIREQALPGTSQTTSPLVRSKTLCIELWISFSSLFFGASHFHHFLLQSFENMP
jgi:hypothetical protein